MAKRSVDLPQPLADDREPLVGRDRQVRLLEREHVAEPVANAPMTMSEVTRSFSFIRRYRRVRVQMPTLGCSDI